MHPNDTPVSCWYLENVRIRLRILFLYPEGIFLPTSQSVLFAALSGGGLRSRFSL